MPVGDILPEIALVLGAVAIIFAAAFTEYRMQSWCAALAAVVLGLALYLTAQQWALADTLTFNGVWALDRAAIAVKSIILAATLVTVCLSPEWLRGDRRHGEYYALLLFAALGAIMMASAHDGMQLIVGVLLSSAATYPLVAFHRQWRPSVEAGLKYFLLGALANAVLAIGVVLAFGLAGDTDYDVLAQALANRESRLVPIAVFICVGVGLSFKLAAFPFYPWMPDVAQGAPAPVAGFLTVVPKLGAALALARFLALIPDTLPWRLVVALMAAATMTAGNLGALLQNDMRRMLGWSSVSQSGYALMAVCVIGIPGAAALPALVVFLLAYATANLTLFAMVTALRGRTAMHDFNGLGAQQPLILIVFIVAALSLVGIPPLVGFFGKLNLFAATLAGGYTWLAVLAVLNTVLSLFYYLRFAAAALFEPSAANVHLLGKLSWSTMLLSAAGVVIFGIMAQVFTGAEFSLA